MTTILLRPNTKISDIIQADKRAMVLLPRFGIDLGVGDNTITQICEMKKIDAHFFILMINTFLDTKPISIPVIKKIDVSTLLLYLENSHAYYLKEIIPHIRKLFEQYASCANLKAKEQLIRFFNQYIIEVEQHIGYEDQVVFPYISHLYSSTSSNGESQVKGSYSIEEFEKRHDNIEEKLTDLKNLLIKYIPPANDRYQRVRLLNELIALEEDLANHGRIEDHILIPIVRQLENKIRK